MGTVAEVRNIVVELRRKVTCRCERCHINRGHRRRQHTSYVDDKLNWARLCNECQADADEYWKERWDEYYAGLM